MKRTADYAIQGFLYQFNKTALEILLADDDALITIEGVIEDIDIVDAEGCTAIQCKYHESMSTFSPSAIYKPLLQMLVHFSQNPDRKIKYVLFGYFSNSNNTWTPDTTTLQAALKSQDKGLQALIKLVPQQICIDDFLCKLSFEHGPRLDSISNNVCRELQNNGISADDIDTLAYPNAIHLIATLSAKHDPTARNITRRDFVSKIQAIRTTAISRWTLGLRTKRKILEARRKQLKANLDKNSRTRSFVIDSNSLENFDTEIVMFIADFLGKYHYKPAHISTPIFCIAASDLQLQDVQKRLYAKNIVVADGYIGGEFQEAHFYRDPFVSRERATPVKREFMLRLLSWTTHAAVLNSRKCDDLFVVGDLDLQMLNLADINLEKLGGVTFNELKFVLGVCDAFE